MIHLQIVAPRSLTARMLELLGDLEAVTNVVVLHEAGLKPQGDVTLCDVTSEEASNVISDLRNLGIDREGSIAIGPPQTELSKAFPEARETGSTAAAVVWEEVQERTSESAELSVSFLLFMIIAILIAAVGIYLNSAILIIGAMIVGPDFGPIAGVCVAAINRQLSQAGRSLLALLAGYTSGAVAAYLMTLALREAELVSQRFDLIHRSLEASITQPGFFPGACRAAGGHRGDAVPDHGKVGALIGVLVSVTTIPAAANVAVTLAYSEAEMFRASILQLATNVGAMLFAGIITLAIQRALYQRRRAAHLRDLAHRGKGPTR